LLNHSSLLIALIRENFKAVIGVVFHEWHFASAFGVAVVVANGAPTPGLFSVGICDDEFSARLGDFLLEGSIIVRVRG
jgi:uncharacterized membrane protein